MRRRHVAREGGEASAAAPRSSSRSPPGARGPWPWRRRRRSRGARSCSRAASPTRRTGLRAKKGRRGTHVDDDPGHARVFRLELGGLGGGGHLELRAGRGRPGRRVLGIRERARRDGRPVQPDGPRALPARVRDVGVGEGLVVGHVLRPGGRVVLEVDLRRSRVVKVAVVEVARVAAGAVVEREAFEAVDEGPPGRPGLARGGAGLDDVREALRRRVLVDVLAREAVEAVARAALVVPALARRHVVERVALLRGRRRAGLGGDVGVAPRDQLKVHDVVDAVGHHQGVHAPLDEGLAPGSQGLAVERDLDEVGGARAREEEENELHRRRPTRAASLCEKSGC